MMIYKATNGFNGMAYIGIVDGTDDLDEISALHDKHAHNTQLAQPGLESFNEAIREFSINAFVFEVLEETDDDKRALKLIEEHATHLEGYNENALKPAKPKRAQKTRNRTTQKTRVTPKRGLTKTVKKPHSEERKAKISKSLTGRRRSPAECQAISDGHAAYNPEKSFYDDPSYKEKISAGNKGKKRSRAHKQAVREGQNRRWHGVSHRGGAFDE